MWFNTLPGLATVGAALLVLALLAAGWLGWFIGRARRAPAVSTNGSRRPSRKDERSPQERATAAWAPHTFPVETCQACAVIPVRPLPPIPAPRRPQLPLSLIETVQLPKVPRINGGKPDVRSMGTTGTVYGHMPRRGASRGVAGR